MILDMLVFALMAYFYLPNKAMQGEESEQQDSPYTNGFVNNDQYGDPKNKKAYTNEGMTEEDTKF